MVLLSSARLGATAAASQGSCVPMECEKTSHLCSLPSYCYSYNRTQNKTALSPQVNRKKRPRITPTSTKTNPQSVTPHMQTTYGNMSAISGASLQVLSSHIVTSQIVLGDHFYTTVYDALYCCVFIWPTILASETTQAFSLPILRDQDQDSLLFHKYHITKTLYFCSLFGSVLTLLRLSNRENNTFFTLSYFLYKYILLSFVKDPEAYAQVIL